MNCISSKTASEFLAVAEDLLLLNESEHNVILGVANSLAKGLLPADDALFISVMSNSLPVGHAIRSDRNKPLAVSRMDPEAAKSLVDYCVNQGIQIHEVTGPADVSESFATAWTSQKEVGLQATRSLGVYELERVIFPAPDGRSLINAFSADREIVAKYVLGFLEECFPDEENPKHRAVELAERQIKNATLYLWKGSEDIEPVSMAAKARETRNGATISLVYTPPHLRGLGFGSRIVAALSDRCLRSGKKFCNLFTDLTNPTSNSIYQKIGYRKLGESKHYVFTKC